MFSTIPRAAHRLVPFDKLDRTCLAFAFLILVLYAVLWIFLIMAAGSAPLGRLSVVCLLWATEAELLVALPVWVAAKLARWFRHTYPRPKAIVQKLSHYRWKSSQAGVPIAR